MGCKNTYHGKRYDSLEALYKDNNKPSKEQRKLIEQMFKEYVDQFGKQDIEGFKEFVGKQRVLYHFVQSLPPREKEKKKNKAITQNFFNNKPYKKKDGTWSSYKTKDGSKSAIEGAIKGSRTETTRSPSQQTQLLKAAESQGLPKGTVKGAIVWMEDKGASEEAKNQSPTRGVGGWFRITSEFYTPNKKDFNKYENWTANVWRDHKGFYNIGTEKEWKSVRFEYLGKESSSKLTAKINQTKKTNNNNRELIDISKSKKKGKYYPKDKAKFHNAGANKLIAFGEEGTHSRSYAETVQPHLLNTGEYDDLDIVGVTVNGGTNSTRDLPRVLNELQKAIAAGSTIVTDNSYDRERSFNTGGEKVVAGFLKSNGYEETTDGNGIWKPKQAKGENVKTKEAQAEHSKPAPKKLSQQQMEKVTKILSRYYENLKKDLGKNPTFEEFMQDFIENNGKSTASEVYHALVEGWKANNYTPTNYDKVYNKLFETRKDISSDLIGAIRNSVEDSPTTPQELKESNDKTMRGVIESTAPILALDEDNRPIFIDANPFKAASPELRAAYLSSPYKRNIIKNKDGSMMVLESDVSDLLINSKNINGMRVLDTDALNPGTILTVRIAPDPEKIYVTEWEDDITKTLVLPFGEWARKKHVKKGSPEWIAKVPMIMYENGKEGVFFVHDTEWYNMINVAFKDDPPAQGKIIAEARENLVALRGKVSSEGEAKLRVKEKRPGSYKYAKKTSTLEENNPDTQLAIADKNNDILLNGNTPLSKAGITLVGNPEAKGAVGHIYEIRKATKTGEYIALEVMREKITPQIQETLYEVVKAYVFQLDKNSTFSDHEAIEKLRQRVAEVTGLDIFNAEDFEKFLNLHILITTGKFSDIQDIENTIEGNRKIKNNTPYFAVQGNNLVFGAKGEAMSIKHKSFYIHPERINDPGGHKQVVNMLHKFKELLPRATQNSSKNGLSENRTTVIIDGNRTVLPGDNYFTYLKKTLRTATKSFNVGTEENPIHATILQPVVHLEMVEEDEVTSEKPKEKEVTTKENGKEEVINKEEPKKKISKKTIKKIDKIVDKIIEKKPLAPKEEVIKEDNPSVVEAKLEEGINKLEITTLLKKVFDILKHDFNSSGHEDSIKILGEQLGVDTEVNSKDEYEAISDEDIELVTDENGRTLRERVTGGNKISILDNFYVVDYIFNELSSRLYSDNETEIDKRQLLLELEGSFEKLIAPRLKEDQDILNRLRTLYTEGHLDPSLQTVINDFEDKIVTFYALRDSWDIIKMRVANRVMKDNIVKVREEERTGEDYAKTSREINSQLSASHKLKMLFRGIKQIKANGQVKTGFLGLPAYVGYNTIYPTVERIILSPYGIDSNFDIILAKLKNYKDNYLWLSQIIERLENADNQMRNKFLFSMVRHSSSVKFLMRTKTRGGQWRLKVYDTNSTEISRTIREQWENNLMVSPLIAETGNEINKDRAEYLLSVFNIWSNEIKEVKGAKFKKTVRVSNSGLQKWLKEFGIYLSSGTLNTLRNKKTTFLTRDGKTKVSFSNMFENNPKTPGIFGLLANYLEKIIQETDTNFERNPSNHPFNNINNVLKTLSRIESKFVARSGTNMFRDGGKSFTGYPPSNHLTDIVRKLKDDENAQKQSSKKSLREQLKSKSFSKHSLLLKLLDEDESFREKFYVDDIGEIAIKEKGRKTYGDNSISALPDSEHELTKLGLFQDLRQGQVKQFLGENKSISLRMARMFLPTVPGKSRMLDFYTAVLNLKGINFNIDKESNVTLKDPLKEVLYSQLVLPELERITTFYSRVKKTNIKNYDTAATMFLIIPELNSLITPEVGALMAQRPDEFNLEWFEKQFKEKAKDIVTNLVAKKVEAKIQNWKDNEFIVEKDGVTEVKFFDSAYFSNGRIGSDNIEEKIKIAANDFVINSLITNMNTYMLFAGDIAQASKEEVADYFEDGKSYLPKKEFGKDVYTKITKDVIGPNLSKRLALLLAPGGALADSMNATYEQVFMNDQVSMASNVETLVRKFYGEGEAKNAAQMLENYLNEDSEEGRSNIAKAFSTKYPDLGAYSNIETTDAQEVTTTSEHIYILLKQGDISDSMYDTIQKKLQEQYEAEAEGKKIPDSALLNYNELKLVLQPTKPVYTGFVDEERFDTMRMVYIKSASFPLIPQITATNEFDGLRKLLEKYQHETGRSVRASYQSANKIGAVSTAITPFLPDGTFNKDLDIEQVKAASLTLNRDSLRIQQQAPFKAGKGETKITQVTQALKLLFGDGMIDLDGFDLDGKPMTGEALYTEFNRNFSKYIGLRRKSLLNRLGVDEEGQPYNVKRTIKKLQELLKEEVVQRGYTGQDAAALKLVPILNENGKVVNLEFSIPLWFLPNSNRYESLLNSIVDNALDKIKLPGDAHILGSKAGFKTQNNLDGIDRNKIIYTSKYNNQLKGYSELGLNQVFVSSSLRDNSGNLIELIDKEGKPNPTYVEEDSNGILRLKEDMIDSKLLNFTSLRIPTSGHVSMSQLEVAGFLPPVCGNLMIFSSNLMAKKGTDNDFDKEYVYYLHTYSDEDGKVKVFDEKEKLRILKDEEDIIRASTERENLKTLEDKGYRLTAKQRLRRSTDNLFTNIFGPTSNYTDEELSDKNRLKRLSSKLDLLIYENNLAKIYSSVLSNNNPEVQKKINRVLSMKFAKEQKKLILDKLASEADNSSFTILSDEYQKEQMYLGSAGELAIAIYSNAVVLHSQIQQAARHTGKQIQLKKVSKKGKETPLVIRIGHLKSRGILGRLKTLSSPAPKRFVSEVMEERQATGTDNLIAGIIGVVGVNEITLDVDSLLSALGFDKDLLTVGEKEGIEVNIPYLFLSQPIIKDYVKKIRETRSNLTEFNKKAREEVISELKSKYAVEQEYDKEKVAGMLTGQTLYDNLTAPENIYQLEVLDIFLLLDKYAKKIGSLQRRLNVSSTGLGKSYFDTVDRYNNLENFQETFEDGIEDGIAISNASALIGDYVPRNPDESRSKKQKMLAQGFVPIGDYYIKPNNPNSMMLVNAVQVGHDLWKNYFPYNAEGVKDIFNEVLPQITSSTTSPQKVTELKQEIFKEMKSSLVTFPGLGLFNGKPQEERRRLFMEGDNEEDISLPQYLNDLVVKNDEIGRLLRSNPLISRFGYYYNKGTSTSSIRFDNTKGEAYDEEYLYMALIELMDHNIRLPNFKGKPYSTRQLAKDLIAYAYLEGGIQEATQFVKYISVEYLNTIPFAGITRSWNSNHNPGVFKSLFGVNSDPKQVSRMTRHFMQSHPGRLLKVDPKTQIVLADYNGKKTGKLSELTSFEINEFILTETQAKEFENAEFVSIYNPEIKKGLKKFQVYEKFGNKYHRISTSGMFGMGENSIQDDEIRSLVNDYYKIPPPAKKITSSKKVVPDVFGLRTNSIHDIATSVSDYNFTEHTHLQPIVKALIPFIAEGTTLEVNDIAPTSEKSSATSNYSAKEKKITISSQYYSTASNEDLAKTIIRELINAVSSDYISQYTDGQRNYKLPSESKGVQRLAVFFSEVRRKLGPELEEFTKGIPVSESISEKERTVAMSEFSFQKEMKNTKYKSTKKNLFGKFVEIINSLMKETLGGDYATSGITIQGIRSALEIGERQASEETPSKYKQMEQTDAAIETFLGTGFGNIVIPSDEEMNNNDKKEGREKDDDPFNCEI